MRCSGDQGFKNDSLCCFITDELGVTSVLRWSWVRSTTGTTVIWQMMDLLTLDGWACGDYGFRYRRYFHSGFSCYSLCCFITDELGVTSVLRWSWVRSTTVVWQLVLCLRTRFCVCCFVMDEQAFFYFSFIFFSNSAIAFLAIVFCKFDFRRFFVFNFFTFVNFKNIFVNSISLFLAKINGYQRRN